MNAFLGKVYAYKFSESFLLILPFFAVMLSEYGMSPLQIGVLFFAWSASQFLLEVPSGILADKYSRKYVLIFAQILQILCFLSFYFFPNFFGFLAGFILWGASEAFSSGTFEALVYDELKSINAENSYTKVIGRAGSLSFIALMAASLIATFAIVLGYKMLLLISAAVVFLGMVPVFFLPNTPIQKGTGERKYFSIAKEGLGRIFADAEIAKAVVLAAVVSAVSMGLFQFWPLIASLSGVPHAGLGVFLAVVAGGQAIASFLAHRLEKLGLSILYVLLLVGGLAVFVLSEFLTIAGLAFVVIFNILLTFLITIFKARLQHLIPSDTRATVLSAMGFLTQIGIFVTCLIFGGLAEAFSYATAIASFGALIVLIALVYLLLSFRKEATTAGA